MLKKLWNDVKEFFCPTDTHIADKTEVIKAETQEIAAKKYVSNSTPVITVKKKRYYNKKKKD